MSRTQHDGVCQRDVLSPSGKHTLTHTHVHLLSPTDRAHSLPPPSLLHSLTHSAQSQEGGKKSGRREFNVLNVSNGSRSPLLERYRTRSPTHTHIPLPRSHGFLDQSAPPWRVGVSWDQHGEPGGKTRGNRVRSAFAALHCSATSLHASLCFANEPVGKTLDLQWSKYNSCELCVMSNFVFEGTKSWHISTGWPASSDSFKELFTEVGYFSL